MRKESKKIAEAFVQRQKASAARTMTDGQSVFLHGNQIAKRDERGAVWVTLAGWPTVTTRERLNAICRTLGSPWGFVQRKHEQFLTNSAGELIPIDDSEWVEVERT